jgi:hypothetical protein
MVLGLCCIWRTADRMPKFKDIAQRATNMDYIGRQIVNLGKPSVPQLQLLPSIEEADALRDIAQYLSMAA